jgi:hypothetical protein
MGDWNCYLWMDTYSSGFEEFCFLGCDIVYSGKSLPTFRRKYYLHFQVEKQAHESIYGLTSQKKILFNRYFHLQKRKLLSTSVSLFITRCIFVFFTFQHLTMILFFAASLNITQMCKTRMEKILQIWMEVTRSSETSLHGIMFQKRDIFTASIVRASNPTYFFTIYLYPTLWLPSTRRESQQKGATNGDKRYKIWDHWHGGGHSVVYYVILGVSGQVLVSCKNEAISSTKSAVRLPTYLFVRSSIYLIKLGDGKTFKRKFLLIILVWQQLKIQWEFSYFYISFVLLISPAFSNISFQSYILSNDAPRPTFGTSLTNNKYKQSIVNRFLNMLPRVREVRVAKITGSSSDGWIYWHFDYKFS